MVTTALILIEVQNDYFEGGLRPLPKSEETLKAIKKVLLHFRETNQMVIHLKHISVRSNAPIFRRQTEGAKIHHEIEPLGDEIVIVKHWPDSFYQTELENILNEHQVERLVFGGMMTHHCVDTTVRVAKGKGYEVVVLEDACTTKALVSGDEVLPEDIVQKTFMASFKDFGSVLTTEDYLNFKL